MRLTIGGGGDGGRAVEVKGERFTVGRDADCDLVVHDEKVSRVHAYLRALPDGRAELHDQSRNGTWVDGERLTGTRVLEGGEEIRVGETRLRALGDPARPGEPVRRRDGSASRFGRTTMMRALESRMRRVVTVSALAVGVALIAVGLAVTGAIGGGGDRPSVAEIAEEIAPSTVLVVTNSNGERRGNGTGWVYDGERGLVVTNAHVVNGGDDVDVGVGDGPARAAKVVGVAPCEDLAVLELEDTSGLETVPLGAQAQLRAGQGVVAVGFAGNASDKDELQTTAGVVSVVRTTWDAPALDVPNYPNVVQTDTAINPGNSGGPLVDLEARLVGVNSAGSSEKQNQNYAIAVDRVKEIVPGLSERRSISWNGMGMSFIPTEDLRRSGLPAGIVVDEAMPGTPAEEAGFGRVPALIEAVDGKRVDNSLQSYCKAVDGIENGRPVRYSIIDDLNGRRERREIDVEFR